MKYKNEKDKKLILIIVIIVLLVLLILLQSILKTVQNASRNEGDIVEQVELKPVTIKGVVEKNDAKYIEETGTLISNIYVDFEHDLYSTDGKSNEDKFNNIIDEIAELKKDSFNLIDEKKNIKIQVIYDKKTDKYNAKINNQDDYYRNNNGKSYSEVEETSLAETQRMAIESTELFSLVRMGMYYAKAGLGEKEEDLDDGYSQYKNGAIKTRNFMGKVRNIIFTDKYEGNIVTNVKVGTPLKDIYELYKNVAFGSVKDGYLGYLTEDVYIFFYENEISIYGYNYNKHIEFEQYLEEYLLSKDLGTFTKKVTSDWTTYDLYEYDSSSQSAHIVFPSTGVEIDIKDNNTKGIILYNNYYLTEKTKRFVKDGLITLKSNDDYIHITEQNRRKSIYQRGM